MDRILLLYCNHTTVDIQDTCIAEYPEIKKCIRIKLQPPENTVLWLPAFPLWIAR